MGSGCNPMGGRAQLLGRPDHHQRDCATSGGKCRIQNGCYAILEVEGDY